VYKIIIRCGLDQLILNFYIIYDEVIFTVPLGCLQGICIISPRCFLSDIGYNFAGGVVKGLCWVNWGLGPFAVQVSLFYP
jgi:hypothetical protein